MSAEVLREAAAHARAEWEGEQSGPFSNAARIHLAVADWLESVAGVHWPKRHDMYSESHYNAEPVHDYFDGRCDESCWRESYICNGCGTVECKPEISGHALTVACAYLGGAR